METNQQQEEFEIDLVELFYVLLNRIGTILIVTILAAVAAGVVNLYVLKPVYTSTSSIYILNKTASLTSISLSDLQLGSQLTKDYMVLIKSRTVTEQVIENLGLDMTHEQLRSIMTINNPGDTRILEISVDYGDAFMAKQIVDEIALVSSRRISEIMDMEEPNIFENGVVASQKTAPHITRNVLICAMLAALVSSIAICVRYLMDDTIKSAEDIEKYLGMNAIGFIPMEQSERERKQEVRRKTGNRRTGNHRTGNHKVENRGKAGA